MRTTIRDNYTPELGQYHEQILVDPTRRKTWLFDCDGVFTDITKVVVVSERGDSEEYAASQKWLTLELEALEAADIALQDNIDAEATTRETADQALQDNIDAEAATREADDETLQDNIDNEEADRIAADTEIWDEIEAIEAASDVVDIVGTYAELEDYDTSALKDNDIIKVLQDETHDDAIAYYRWNDSSDEFVFVGVEGPYYTASETDTLLAGKVDKTSVTSTPSFIPMSASETLVMSQKGVASQVLNTTNGGIQISSTGGNASAGHTAAIAIGPGAETGSSPATAIGYSAKAPGACSLALGYQPNASGDNSISLSATGASKAAGYRDIVIGSASTEVAAGATQTSDNLAIGSSNTAATNPKATGGFSTAIGHGGVAASGQNSTAIGTSAVTASGSNSTALGYGTITASGNSSTALGNGGITASGNNSTALGNNGVTASGNKSVAIGNNGTTASGVGSLAIGATSGNASAVTAAGENDIAIGNTVDTKTSEGATQTGGNTAIGHLTVRANGGNATAIGNSGIFASGLGSIAFGRSGVTASGNYSTAIGHNTLTASGASSTAIGSNGITASGQNATAIGNSGVTASAADATAIGSNGTTASGTRSIAVGFGVKAANDRSAAFGCSGASSGQTTETTGYYSTSVGCAAKTSGNYSVAVGFNVSNAGASSAAFGSSGVSVDGNSSYSVAIGANSVYTYDSYNVAIGTSGASAGDSSPSSSSSYNYAFGGQGVSASGGNSVAIGTMSTTASAARTVALGHRNCVASHADSVALGTDAATGRTFEVSLGKNAAGSNPEVTKYIAHVTAGVNDTDAVNVAQLNAAIPGAMTGATSSAAGTSGLVPAPAAGDDTKFLKGDGTWGEASGGATIFYTDQDLETVTTPLTSFTLYKDVSLTSAATAQEVCDALVSGQVILFQTTMPLIYTVIVAYNDDVLSYGRDPNDWDPSLDDIQIYYFNPSNKRAFELMHGSGGADTWSVRDTYSFAPPTIVQTTGQSTTSVMSQKAVTDAIPVTNNINSTDWNALWQ